MNILILDDEKEIADLVELYLKNINTQKIDLAILDVMIARKKWI